MRQISEKAAGAFAWNNRFACGNTQVMIEDGKTKMFLHGNLIAEKIDGNLFITNANWFSNVTKERLNGICGVSIQQIKGVWYLNGKEWNGEMTNVSEWNRRNAAGSK